MDDERDDEDSIVSEMERDMMEFWAATPDDKPQGKTTMLEIAGRAISGTHGTDAVVLFDSFDVQISMRDRDKVTALFLAGRSPTEIARMVTSLSPEQIATLVMELGQVSAIRARVQHRWWQADQVVKAAALPAARLLSQIVRDEKLPIDFRKETALELLDRTGLGVKTAPTVEVTNNTQINNGDTTFLAQIGLNPDGTPYTGAPVAVDVAEEEHPPPGTGPRQLTVEDPPPLDGANHGVGVRQQARNHASEPDSSATDGPRPPRGAAAGVG